jgi:hypothetical protein
LICDAKYRANLYGVALFFDIGLICCRRIRRSVGLKVIVVIANRIIADELENDAIKI